MQTLIFVITGMFIVFYIIDKKAPIVPDKVDYLKTKESKDVVELEQEVENEVFSDMDGASAWFPFGNRNNTSSLSLYPIVSAGVIILFVGRISKFNWFN